MLDGEAEKEMEDSYKFSDAGDVLANNNPTNAHSFLELVRVSLSAL